MSTPTLLLQRLRVAQLRKFDDLTLDALTPGLNIFAGPNGAGKSTLARAIRAAFLDRYSASAAAADLQPLGHGSAAPTVELDFILRGVPHKLVKTFLKRKRCDLQAGHSQRSEQDAEDYLAEALGFGFGARSGKAEHWGVPGLLWVEQGFQPDQLASRVGFAAQHLGAALHDAQPQYSQGASSLAATAGDALIAQLEQALAAFIGKSGKPVGAYAQLLERTAELQAQLHTQQQRIADYRSQVDELAQLQAQAQAQAEQPPEPAWQQELAAARARLAQARQLESQQQRDLQQLQQLESQQTLLAQGLHGHAQQQAAVQRRAQAVDAAQHAVYAVRAQHAAVRQRVAQAQADHAQAQAMAQHAQYAHQREHIAQRLAAHNQQCEHLRQAQTQAEQALQQLKQLTQAASALKIEKTDVAQLRKLEAAALHARLQRDALATLLAFDLPAGHSLDWQTHSTQGRWSAQGQHWLDRATTVRLPGGGSLTITPGGEDVAGAAQSLERSQAALQAALQRLGVDSAAQAQEQAEQRQALLAQQQLAQHTLALHAPHGLEALQLALQQEWAQADSLRAQWQALPDTPPALDWPQAHAAEHATAAALETARQDEQSARQQAALAEQSLQSAQQELQAAQQQWQDPTAQARHAQMQQEALLLQAAHAQLQQQVQRQQADLQRGDAAFATQDIERLERTLAAHAQQGQQRELRMASLRSALEQAGAQGLEEVCAQTAMELAYAQRRAQDMAQHAQALQTVVQRLKDKRSQALRRLQAPLEKRMNHYLQLLLPGASVQLDEHLLPQRVQAQTLGTGMGIAVDAASPRLAGEVAHASYGTQEQMAIISRLAYADVLQSAGRPTLLMLDDALVHSDAQRLAQMKRVLFDAATRHQVLLFTCKPQDWMDAGAPVRQLPAQ